MSHMLSSSTNANVLRGWNWIFFSVVEGGNVFFRMWRTLEASSTTGDAINTNMTVCSYGKTFIDVIPLAASASLWGRNICVLFSQRWYKLSVRWAFRFHIPQKPRMRFTVTVCAACWRIHRWKFLFLISSGAIFSYFNGKFLRSQSKRTCNAQHSSPSTPHSHCQSP